MDILSEFCNLEPKYKIKIAAFLVGIIGLLLGLGLELITRREEGAAKRESDRRFDSTVTALQTIVNNLETHSQEANHQFNTSITRLQGITTDINQAAKQISRIDLPLDLVTVRWSVGVKVDRPLMELPMLAEILAADQKVKERTGQNGLGVFDVHQSNGQMGSKEFSLECPMLMREIDRLQMQIDFSNSTETVISYSGPSTVEDPPRLSFVSIHEDERIVSFNVDFSDVMARNQRDDFAEINIRSLAGTAINAHLYYNGTMDGTSLVLQNLNGEIVNLRLWIVTEDGKKAVELDGDLFSTKTISGAHISASRIEPLESYAPYVQPNFYLPELRSRGRLVR